MSANRSVLFGALGVVAVVLLWALRDVVILVGLAMVLAYLLDPLVSVIQRLRAGRLRITRPIAAALVIMLLVAGVIWTLVLVVPRLGAEFGHFVQGAPGNAQRLLEELRLWAQARGLGPYADPVLEQLRAEAPQLLSTAAGAVGGWAAKALGNLPQLLGLLLLPFLAFYLLAEREAVQESALRFMPEAAHGHLRVANQAVDQALRSYVRGQTVVCLVIGTATGAALALIGFPYAILLGLLAGIAEVLPYIGFWIVTVTIGLVGYGVGPLPALLGFGAYLAINTLVGFLVTPRVMGRHLEMHPFTVTVSVLAGGELLGPAGVILALPGAAVIQALVRAFAPARAKKAKA